MQMDEEEGLSFGYQLPTDVTAAVKRALLKGEAAGGGAGDIDSLGPFVYHAEGLTFAFIEHQGPEGGEGFQSSVESSGRNADRQDKVFCDCVIVTLIIRSRQHSGSCGSPRHPFRPSEYLFFVRNTLFC